MKKYKLSGDKLVKKINGESLTVDDLIEHLTWFSKTYKEEGWPLPIKIEVVTYNKDATKSCTATLDSWCAGGNINKNKMTLTLVAESNNDDLIDKDD